jgi:hypothetical protein
MLGAEQCPARLACVRHAASVHPEPGSNPQINLSAFPLTEIHFAFLHSALPGQVQEVELLNLC